nr:rod-binding protein [Desulfobulbaceae bacterium]
MKIQQNQFTPITRNDVSADAAKDIKLKKACNDFEAIIVKQLLTSMRKSIPKGGLFGNGFENETFQSMQDDELAKSIAHGKGIGIAQALYNEVSGKTSQTTNIGQPYDTIK